MLQPDRVIALPHYASAGAGSPHRVGKHIHNDRVFCLLTHSAYDGKQVALVVACADAQIWTSWSWAKTANEDTIIIGVCMLAEREGL